METIGSAKIQNYRGSGYQFLHYNRFINSYLFFNKNEHKYELFARHKNPIAGWNLKYKGYYYEFCSQLY
jgi:hypothetical protein